MRVHFKLHVPTKLRCFGQDLKISFFDLKTKQHVFGLFILIDKICCLLFIYYCFFECNILLDYKMTYGVVVAMHIVKKRFISYIGYSYAGGKYMRQEYHIYTFIKTIF